MRAFVFLLCGFLVACEHGCQEGPGSKAVISEGELLVSSAEMSEAPLAPEPEPTTAEAPLLHMPFEPGVAVLCSQGNNSPEGYTHSSPQNRYALDFAVPGQRNVLVVAAASGVVAEVVDYQLDNLDAGYGYGRQVVLEHADGWFTRYAHLASIQVGPGERIKVGEALGEMGRSGHAFSRHLHFTLRAKKNGDLDDVPIARLSALVLGSVENLKTSPEESILRAADFHAQVHLPWLGGLYAHSGVAPKNLSSLLSTLRRRVALENLIPFVEAVEPGAVERALLPFQNEGAHDPVFLYYQAVGVHLPQQQWVKAENALIRARALADEPHLYEKWLPAWIEAQLGALLISRESRGDQQITTAEVEQVIKHFKEASRLYPSNEIEEFRQHQLLQLGRYAQPKAEPNQSQPLTAFAGLRELCALDSNQEPDPSVVRSVAGAGQSEAAFVRCHPAPASLFWWGIRVGEQWWKHPHSFTENAMASAAWSQVVNLEQLQMHPTARGGSMDFVLQVTESGVSGGGAVEYEERVQQWGLVCRVNPKMRPVCTSAMLLHSDTSTDPLRKTAKKTNALEYLGQGWLQRAQQKTAKNSERAIFFMPWLFITLPEPNAGVPPQKTAGSLPGL